MSQNTSSISANPRALARRALEAVYGVDINPFAVAIARFRLIIAFAKACGLSRLREMPDVKVNVATGDSLLHGNTICSAKGWGVQELSDWLPDAFAAGDFKDASRILGQRYHAVVGNPPYITARDKAHNNEVRSRYRTAYMKYSLAVPFKEKFWDLAVEGRGQQRAGFVGMITANSFMKREFGSRVIEEFFPRVDLTHVIDTSGAYIPGHGTPTVILLGRNRAPVSATVRAVLGIRGEPSTPADPAQGLVWRSIVELLERQGESNAFVSVTEFDRATFAKHPWSIGGGGASELKERIESASQALLGESCDSIGFASFTGQDDVFAAPFGSLERHAVPKKQVRGFVEGDTVRDYVIHPTQEVLVPYDASLGLCPLEKVSQIGRFLWAYRNNLANIKTFGNKTKTEAGEPWWGWYRWVPSKYQTPLSIAFAEVATHNHFVLDRGGKVFNRTAPVIKLPNGATEDEHLALLGLLNSSLACFWFKQVCHNKGATSDSGVLQADPEKFRFCFDGSKVEKFPVPAIAPEEREHLIALVGALDEAGSKLGGLDWQSLIDQPSSYKEFCHTIETVFKQREQIRHSMVRWQEELDWLVYEIYGLNIPFEARSLSHTLTPEAMPATNADQRPYRRGEVIAPVDQARQALSSSDEFALLEQPEYKRRWFRSAGAYDANNLNDSRILRREIETWLLNKIEDVVQTGTHLATCENIASELAKSHPQFHKVLQFYLDTDDFDFTGKVTQLVQPQAVPYLAALRYSEAGLRIRADWERTWELQRREDAGETVENILVPPKYGQKDFLRSEFWSLRGKLDVPKERFISFPGAEREADASPVIGWAGWNHLQRAQALASYALERREQDGWEKDRLTPLLAGVAELLPWLKQWHNEVDPHSGERMGDYFESFLSEQLRELDLTLKDLSDWRPAQKAQSARKPRKSST